MSDEERAPEVDEASEASAEPAAEASAEEGAAAPLVEPRGVAWKAALLAWLFPGLGHLYTGRWLRGLAYAAIVLALIAGGCALDGKLWRPAGNPFAAGPGAVSALLTVLSVGMGLPYGALLAGGYRGVVTAQGYEYGTTFLLTAALMNLLLVFDARDLALGRKP